MLRDLRGREAGQLGCSGSYFGRACSMPRSRLRQPRPTRPRSRSRPATGSGRVRRCTAPYAITETSTTSVAPLAVAARMPARWLPKLRLSSAGRFVCSTANHARRPVSPHDLLAPCVSYPHEPARFREWVRSGRAPDHSRITPCHEEAEHLMHHNHPHVRLAELALEGRRRTPLSRRRAARTPPVTR